MDNLPQIKKEESLPYVLFDKLDDELIIKEMEGKLPDVLTYHFKDKGSEIWGLSKAGVDESKNELAKKGECIRELELNFTDGKDEAFFNVKVGRYIVNKDGNEILLDTAFGTKRQPKKTVKGNENPFWYEQGAMKAARNAAFRLIPKSIVQAIIEYAKKEGKVRLVEPGQESQTSSETPSLISNKPDPGSPPLQEYSIIQAASITKQGTNKKGNPWTLYSILTKDGEKYGTFDKKIYETAVQYWKFETPCVIGWEKTEKGNKNAISIEPVDIEEREIGEEG